ncbi:TLC domain-containing protein [Ditylenchus destructor]|uniref:Translocating chain-associated membrane protein n=1 Tax=Ditylenchus destructor TaxID=166010 RepID=A0AAD4MWN0_9BILA|nr:TLC domain-containing protein [Ditylenchus destructor]
MGIEARRAALSRSKKSSPPILSHEFVITNHGDIISCVIMLFMLGFMFQITSPLSQLFIVPQYNDTVTLPNHTEPQLLYRSGLRDLPALFFYALVWIAVHCAIQEYFIDKMSRRLHLSKTRQTKSNESGQLFVFSTYSLIHAGYILHEMGLHKDFTLLWNGYPEAHRHITLSTKLFFIFQISYWIHQFPEFYFQKLKRDEIRSRTVYSILFFGFTALAYFANFNRLALALLFLEYVSQSVFHLSRLLYFTGKVKKASTAFKAWNGIFVIIRFAIVLVSVLTLWYGLRSHETPFIDVPNGNWNTQVVRLNTLVVIVLVQLYMLFNFCMFHFGRFRERTQKPVKAKGAATKNQKKAKSDEANDIADDQPSSPEAKKQK